MTTPPREHWLIYALGGGMGHVGRAVALARAARRPGRSFRIVTNSPFAIELPIERELGPTATVARIGPDCDRDEVARFLDGELSAGFDVLVVDTFPRGLGGELAPWLDRLRVPKVLVHRDLDPRYVTRADLRGWAARYDLILVPGEPAPLGDLPHAARTAPWFLREPGELLARDAARRALGVSDEAIPVVVAIGSGRPEESDAMGRLAARLGAELGDRAAVRFASVLDGAAVRHWPLFEWMRGIDLIVGSGGYPSVHEARATGTPLVALARPRLYDRQDHRLRPDERVADEDEALDRVREWLDRPRRASVPDFENGTGEAVKRIGCAHGFWHV